MGLLNRGSEDKHISKVEEVEILRQLPVKSSLSYLDSSIVLCNIIQINIVLPQISRDCKI